MLLFIQGYCREVVELFPFKYISCYCLSLVTVSGLFCSPYSNTSHVIVYPILHMYAISPSGIQIHLMLLFIPAVQNFKPPEDHSNTSHVIVYPAARACVVAALRIQIHLMLLFIEGERAGAEPGQPFKYISCYCLSNTPDSPTCCMWYSNTSHVIVYPAPLWYSRQETEFKYISCYCLS